MAKFIAIVVRNAMETFHVNNLSNSQMKELNPIIRNAICTALDAAWRSGEDPVAEAWMASQVKLIPSYWEEPEFLADYVESLRYYEPDKEKREKDWLARANFSKMPATEVRGQIPEPRTDTLPPEDSTRRDSAEPQEGI